MFYTNFIILCNKIGKAPSTVAEEIGFARATVTAWKGGKIPRPATLQKIASYFHITVEELVEEQKNPAPSEGDGLSPARRELLAEVDGMTEEEIFHLLDVIRAVKGKK